MNVSYDPTDELLSSLYKSLRSGTDDLCSVTPKISDRFMLTNVTSQIEKYSEYTKKAEEMMLSRDLYPQEPSLLSRMVSRGAVAVNTLTDPGRAGIAGVIARGTYRGAKKLGRTLEKCCHEGCDPDAAALCREVIGYQLNEADKMKDFM